MQGNRIEQAKQALILFLKSLPPSSKYNIISFGTNFKKMYESSIAYEDESIEETIKEVEKFIADFGGTELA